MDTFAALERSRAELDRRLGAVGPDQWSLPTPCTDWDVRALLQHLIAGSKLAVALLDGAGRDDAIARVREWHVVDSAASPDDALGEFARAADAEGAAFRAPGAFDRTCHHPIGDVPGAQLARFRIGDMTLHAWDVARATGGDETLDAELVADVYESMLPMTPFIGTVGVFGTGPSGTLDDAAPTQQRLLDLSGRRP